MPAKKKSDPKAILPPLFSLWVVKTREAFMAVLALWEEIARCTSSSVDIGPGTQRISDLINRVSDTNRIPAIDVVRTCASLDPYQKKGGSDQYKFRWLFSVMLRDRGDMEFRRKMLLEAGDLPRLFSEYPEEEETIARLTEAWLTRFETGAGPEPMSFEWVTANAAGKTWKLRSAQHLLGSKLPEILEERRDGRGLQRFLAAALRRAELDNAKAALNALGRDDFTRAEAVDLLTRHLKNTVRFHVGDHWLELIERHHLQRQFGRRVVQIWLKEEFFSGDTITVAARMGVKLTRPQQARFLRTNLRKAMEDPKAMVALTRGLPKALVRAELARLRPRVVADGTPKAVARITRLTKAPISPAEQWMQYASAHRATVEVQILSPNDCSQEDRAHAARYPEERKAILNLFAPEPHRSRNPHPTSGARFV